MLLEGLQVERRQDQGRWRFGRLDEPSVTENYLIFGVSGSKSISFLEHFSKRQSDTILFLGSSMGESQFPSEDPTLKNFESNSSGSLFLNI